MNLGYPSLTETQDRTCQCSAAELVCSIAFPVACERTSGGNVESLCRQVRPICVPELAWRLHSASCLSKSNVFVCGAGQISWCFSINIAGQIAGRYRWIVSNYSMAIRHVHLVPGCFSGGKASI